VVVVVVVVVMVVVVVVVVVVLLLLLLLAPLVLTRSISSRLRPNSCTYPLFFAQYIVRALELPAEAAETRVASEALSVGLMLLILAVNLCGLEVTNEFLATALRENSFIFGFSLCICFRV